MIRILVVDDQKMIRLGLEAYLEPEPDIEIVGSFGDGHSALDQMDALRPDVALVDIEMPGLDGLTMTQMVANRFPETRVLILSSRNDEAALQQAMQAGARGYLLKNTSPDELASAIRSVHRGFFQLAPELGEKILPVIAAIPSGEQELPEVVQNRLKELERKQEVLSSQQVKIEYQSRQAMTGVRRTVRFVSYWVFFLIILAIILGVVVVVLFTWFSEQFPNLFR